MPGTDGRLRLQFSFDPAVARTRLQVLEQRQPLKVVRAFALEDGAALVHLHNLSGGVLSEDRLSLAMGVGANAKAQITSTSATRVYRSRAGARAAELITRVHVGPNALMEYLPDPLIPFSGARLDQQTAVHLSEGAGLFWWETLAPGREAGGELFSYDDLRFRFDLSVGGMPVMSERAELKPLLRRLTSLARLGPYRYLSSFYICRAGAAEAVWTSLERQLSDLASRATSPVIIWGLTRLPVHGLVVRALSQKGRDITRGLITFWRVAKQILYGQEAVVPRKIY